MTFDHFSEGEEGLDFLTWLGVVLSPEREGYDYRGLGPEGDTFRGQ